MINFKKPDAAATNIFDFYRLLYAAWDGVSDVIYTGVVSRNFTGYS